MNLLILNRLICVAKRSCFVNVISSGILYLARTETFTFGVKIKCVVTRVLLVLTGPEHMLIQGHQVSNVIKFENHLEEICKIVTAMKKKLIIEIHPSFHHLYLSLKLKYYLQFSSYSFKLSLKFLYYNCCMRSDYLG